MVSNLGFNNVDKCSIIWVRPIQCIHAVKFHSIVTL